MDYTEPRRRAPTGPEAEQLFVGRERELEDLRSAFLAAVAGMGRLYLLTGEPGIGKTHLAARIGAEVRSQGATVLWGRCWEEGYAPPFWPWIQILRSHFRSADPETLAAQLGNSAALLGQLDPELAERLAVHSEPVDQLVSRTGLSERLGTLSGPTEPMSVAGGQAPAELEEARFVLFDAVSSFLARLGEAAPTVIVLDDLHAADPGTLLLLRFVARQLPRARLLIVATYRDLEAQRSAAGALLAGLAREARVLRLSGLSEGEVRRLVEQVAGEPVDEDLVSELLDVTGGNPFFVDETTRLLATEGRLAAAGLRARGVPVPEGVRAALRRRLDHLEMRTRDALVAAAIAGRDFDLDILAAVTSRPVDDLLAALEEGSDAGFVRGTFPALGRFSFAHDLVRETLLSGMPAAERAVLHRRVAEAVEDLRADDLDAHAAELAYHLAQAADQAALSRAVPYLVRAGERAARALAYETARDQFEQALGADAFVHALDEERRRQLLLRVGEVTWRSGDFQAARARFLQAFELARADGAATDLALAAVGYAVGLGGFFFTFRADDLTVRLLDEALEALGDADSELRVRVLAYLVVELYYTRDLQRARALAGEAVACARRVGDPAAQLVALYSWHWAALGPDTLDERLDNAAEMLRLAETLRDDEAAFLARTFRLSCALEQGDISIVDAEVAACARLAARLHQPLYRWRSLCLETMRRILAGRYSQAQSLAEEALQVGRLRGEEIVEVLHRVQVFAIHWARGRWDEMAAEAEALAETYPWVPRWRNALTAVLAGPAAAQAELERHAGGDFEDLPRDGLWLLHLCALAHACVAASDAPRAAQLFGLLEPYAQRNTTTLADQSYGSVSLRLGMLAALLGRWEEAERRFGDAHATHLRMGAPGFEAVGLVEHARALLSRGHEEDNARAVELLRRAEALCVELDLPGRLEEVRTLLDSIAPGPATRPVNVLRLEGDYWSITFRGESFRMKDLKGLRYLARLIAHPGHDWHALDLVADTVGVPAAGAGADDRLLDADVQVGRPSDAGELLDAPARTAYRKRIAALRAAMEEAHSRGDASAEDQAEEELRFLTRELAAAVGLGHRPRRAGDTAERARLSVTKAIKAAIARVEDHSPALGAHLRATVRTGTYCSYTPPGDGFSWQL